MLDRYGRSVFDLRVSLTQRCNLRCVFCHMEGQLPSTVELTPAEIERAVAAGTHVGIDRVKLTGGEPTLRSDLIEIVQRLRPWVHELSMTTNGLRLAELAAPLRAAGLDRVNVSLPSLDPERYRELTGVDGLERVLEGLRAARAAGLAPIKINTVSLSGVTDTPESVRRHHELAAELGAWWQVIEFENVRGRVDPQVYRSLHSELGRLTMDAARAAFSTATNPLHARPQYTVPSPEGPPIVVEVVQPVENPEFCMACHRLRLTSDGHLKGCLMTNEGLVDLRPWLGPDGSLPELIQRYELAIERRRPFFVGEVTPAPSGVPRSEGAIGTTLPVVASP